MKIIGLDLSTKCSGYSIFIDGELIDDGQFKPKTTLSTLNKIEFIAREVFKRFERELDIDKVIIEDIYLAYYSGGNQVKGFANLGRLSGAVIAILCLITGKKADEFIELRMANVARPIVGVNAHSQKAEIQVWVLDKFTDHETCDYKAMIESAKAEKIEGILNLASYKRKMEKISGYIEDETGFGEDISDAILLGYGEVLKGENDVNKTTL